MTDEEFYRIHVYLKSRYGIDMSRKKEIVAGRMDNYIRTGGWRNYTEFMNAVETDFTGNLERELVNLLSTNHTFFMREFEHFEYMKNTVLPELKKKEEEKKDLNIWCGAASTGEEPYTIAMVIKEFFGLEHHQWDTKILATDVSTEALGHAIAGIYKKEQIAGLQESWKRRFFRTGPDEEHVEVTNELKEEVLFRQFNLMEVFPFRRKMHIIFLRNVMIYFDTETKKQLTQKLYDVLEPGGYLFIGRTETLEKGDIPFRLVQPSVFRKEEGK